MLKITEEQAKAIRRKRADLSMSVVGLSRNIGVSRHTISKIEQGNYMTKPTVYAKVMEWLAEGY
ncbi:helix-turn-helix domain-containing protein [Lactococcus garvieae]|uniref:helix-turn-helix domain-containing protein n=1 Tax=Lactococcus garvieae TaxID=1363 RepID=UPI00398EBA65